MSILQDAVAGRAILRPWTVDLYHRALESGWLEESTALELLDGFIVRKEPDRLCVQRLLKLTPLVDARGCTLQIQQPIQFPPDSEPGPDVSVVRGVDDDDRGGQVARRLP